MYASDKNLHGSRQTKLVIPFVHVLDDQAKPKKLTKNTPENAHYRVLNE